MMQARDQHVHHIEKVVERLGTAVEEIWSAQTKEAARKYAVLETLLKATAELSIP